MASTLRALALLLAVAASAQGSEPTDLLPEGLSIHAENNVRWELWRFFEPAPPGGDPDYDFLANRLRVDVRYDQPLFSLHAAGQYVQLGSLPRDAAGSPGGALGAGALYFAHAGQRSPSAVQLKVLSAQLRDPFDLGLELSAGRFGYASGLEADSGSPRLEALKRRRIADRLVGEFGWSHFQRSFDGARLRWDRAASSASLAWLRPTEGGFEDGGTTRIDEIDVALAAWTTRPGRPVPGAELQAFYLLYDDERPIRARVDNVGAAPPDRQRLRIHSFGGHLVGAWPLGPGHLDLLAWAVLQTGRWFELEHQAAAGALEVGFQWASLPWKPWLRIGTFRSTGDGDPDDSAHETFFQVLPTARLYSLTATNNLMNSTDSFVELRLAPSEQLTLSADVHDLRLSNRNDGWYAGAGATRSHGSIVGYSARPSGGHRHLGTVAQLGLTFRATRFLTLNAFYGHLWGGNVVETSFTDGDDLDFFYLELKLHAGLRGG